MNSILIGALTLNLLNRCLMIFNYIYRPSLIILNIAVMTLFISVSI